MGLGFGVRIVGENLADAFETSVGEIQIGALGIDRWNFEKNGKTEYKYIYVF